MRNIRALTAVPPYQSFAHAVPRRGGHLFPQPVKTTRADVEAPTRVEQVIAKVRAIATEAGLAPDVAEAAWPEVTKRPDLTVKQTKQERHAALSARPGTTRSGLNPSVFSDMPCCAAQT